MRKFFNFFNTFDGVEIWGTLVILMTLAYAETARGQELSIATPGTTLQEALDLQLYNCIAGERATWSVIGKAEFVGQPWVYSWTLTEEWDNTAGKMVAINPTVHTFPVPGEQLRVTFEDGSSFTYGETLTDTNRVVWADNLGSLALYGMDNVPPPYTAVKWMDGTIVLLKAETDETCSIGWYLKQPD